MTSDSPNSKDWLDAQMKAYEQEVPIYRSYAEALENILKRLCKIRLPTAIIQARAKGMPNFAEKALRKQRSGDWDAYDPVNQFMDLCAARVITHTQEQVDMLVAFIREHFDVDEDHSQDTAIRLQSTQFGYRSVHLIVRVKNPSILGVDLPLEIGRRRAEIQLRTIVQHAWAEVTHDLIYKCAFSVPEKLIRDCSRIAALLENADQAFGQLVNDLEEYRLDQGAYLTAQEMNDEIETLKTIKKTLLETEAETLPSIDLRIARVAGAAGNWQQVIQALEPHETTRHMQRPEILTRLGHALCRLHVENVTSPSFRRGQRLLEETARPDDPIGTRFNFIRSQALAHLAWSYSLSDRELGRAQSLFHRSYLCDPGNPFLLLAHVESKLMFENNTQFVPTLRPALMAAVEACRRYIEVKIELPAAYFAMGRFLLLLGREIESLTAYAKAIHCCHGCTELKETLITSQKLLGRLGEQLPGLALVERLLALGVLIKETPSIRKRSPSHEEGQPFTDWVSPGIDRIRSPILIVAGGTRDDFEPAAREYDEILFEALKDFRGTVISGGTTSGICGVLGRVKRALLAVGNCPFELLAYLPEGELPSNASIDPTYHVIRSGRGGFSAAQPLQNWIDILGAGNDPRDVRLLNINGGEISAFECRLALALGATVGVVVYSGREAAKLFPDTDWNDTAKLLPLPRDRMTLRAFINSGHPATALTSEQLEAASRAIHENYRQANAGVLADAGMQNWEDLREDFKKSNRQQASHAEQILRACGFGIRPRQAGKSPVQFSQDELMLMAEMEHGRWNDERLASGWRYGPVKNAAKRVSPYIAPWTAIEEKIKKYDVDAVRRFPDILAMAGLEVYRLNQPVAP